MPVLDKLRYESAKKLRPVAGRGLGEDSKRDKEKNSYASHGRKVPLDSNAAQLSVVGSFEIWKRALPTWTATSSSHMTPPVREVVGAVYDRAFSCRTKSRMSRIGSMFETILCAPDFQLVKLPSCPTEKKKRAVYRPRLQPLAPRSQSCTWDSLSRGRAMARSKDPTTQLSRSIRQLVSASASFVRELSALPPKPGHTVL